MRNFRPERTPFQNLAAALAKQLDISNPYTVQGELNHGFSALVDLYKNSKRFVDTHSSAWLSADDKGKAAIKREAANLIILVDQFEEFFTNPENYQHGAPSRDANLVLNLLLETARIALDEDIPIYVIFTMRSDYIGQCAAFRGLTGVYRLLAIFCSPSQPLAVATGDRRTRHTEREPDCPAIDGTIDSGSDRGRGSVADSAACTETNLDSC